MKKIRILCALLCVLIIVSAAPAVVSAKKAELTPSGEAPVYYINSYEQLKNLAYTAQADCRYILSDDIIQNDNLNDLEIVIPTGAVFNLDLNGFNIQRSTQGNDCALFRIKSDGRMTINDTSAGKTGGCSFSEGYADYYKAVFLNEGGELEILNGYYEIFSPYEQGDCSILRTTSGYTNIYDGTFDSSASWGGDTISVGHLSYLYDVPHVNIFGGDFYGKYSSIEVSPFGDYLEYGCLYPSVYVLGGNFYVTKENESGGFAYCNNGCGRVIVAEGKVLYKCLNSIDQRFVEGVSKKIITDTIDDYDGTYYEVTAPPMIMSDGLDYYYRLIGLCDKAVINSYSKSVYELHKDDFDEILDRIDTIMVSETEKTSPEIKLENRTADHQYINWYMVDEAEYNGENTNWTHIGNMQNVSQWTPDERPENGACYIIRCVATKSDLSTYEDIIRIYYEPLKKAEIIDSVKVSGVKIPASGEAPDFELTAEDSFYINGVYWKDLTDNTYLKEIDVFKAGHEYQLEVWIRANEYYNFKTDSDDCIDIKAFVDDKEAEVILPGTSISAELTITYTVSAEPVKPTETTEPTETTVTEPVESSDATEPSKPADSTDSIKPSMPADSTDSTKPSMPADSTDPTEPSTPSTEDQTKPSDEPSKPTTPSDTKPSDPVGDKGILGDVNGDGKVNIKDATLIQKSAAKLIELTDAEKLCADVNFDTKINIKDATAIQKYVAKIETGLPIGEKIV